ARRARRRRGAWATAGGLMLAAVVAIVARGTRPTEPGPLHQIGGGEPSVLLAPASPTATETTFALDDGSRIAMAAGGRATVVENSGRAFVVVLSEGSATFDVHPGGPRRWSIECGLATVEVVGTRFTIDRGASSVVV